MRQSRIRKRQNPNDGMHEIEGLKMRRIKNDEKNALFVPWCIFVGQLYHGIVESVVLEARAFVDKEGRRVLCSSGGRRSCRF